MCRPATVLAGHRIQCLVHMEIQRTAHVGIIVAVAEQLSHGPKNGKARS